MKILIVSKYFYPDNTPRSFRTTELAEELLKQGHDVTVLLQNSDYHQKHFGKKGNGLKFINLGDTKLKNLKGKNIVVRFINRLLLQLFEFPDIQLVWMLTSSLKQLHGFDLLISIAVPHTIHWGVALSLKNKGLTKKWIADCGDPYMGCKTDSFSKVFYFRYVEQFWCRKADFITIPIYEAVSGYYEEFWPKIKIIPQGFKFDQINENLYVKNNIPVFAFAGTLSLKYRNPIPFVEYLLTLKTDFKFIVFNESDILKPYIDKLKGKIEVRNYLPREELLVLLSKMDFLVNFDNATNIQSPSKLIDYALTKRPILSIGNQINTNQISEFMSGYYSNGFTFPDLSMYNIKNVANSFIKLVE